MITEFQSALATGETEHDLILGRLAYQKTQQISQVQQSIGSIQTPRIITLYSSLKTTLATLSLPDIISDEVAL